MTHENNFPRKLEKKEIAPVNFRPGETLFVVQRHEEYQRNEGEGVGSLTSKGRIEGAKFADQYFTEQLNLIPESERKDVSILIVASDTQYKGGGKRSLETAMLTQEAIQEKLNDYGLDESQILNLSGKLKGDKGPRPISQAREPQFIDNSPEFLRLLAEKYGEGQFNVNAWRVFEEDLEKEHRIKMGAEGPDEITDRFRHLVEILKRFSNIYHLRNPGKRLIVWIDSHYDTISPFVKREIFKTTKDVPLGVDYGAGIAIKFEQDGSMNAIIDGKKYSF